MEFGFKAKIDLNEGLKRTVDWYRKKGRVTIG
jgi:nucleoside-diphosphate-sugar epimerase